jgi:hypothetical protein
LAKEDKISSAASDGGGGVVVAKQWLRMGATRELALLLSESGGDTNDFPRHDGHGLFLDITIRILCRCRVAPCWRTSIMVVGLLVDSIY